ncbi:MAG TPA: Ig-like domain-containing protein, partial [Thermoanaerobaculia bacterium]|nr:Ig-like domain-containing protein [Thermoanaerobaculia bacterium]
MNHPRPRKTLIRAAAGALLFFALPLFAGEVAKARLDILGVALEVDREPVIAGIGVPVSVQTIFGGKTNELAPAAPGFSAVGELTGPGIDTPITLSAQPGWGISLPTLDKEGDYLLQNIRLVGPGGEFVQQAVPSIATINITGVLGTRVKVRQLTPEELRSRGITVDARNYEVYEYTFIFGVRGQEVEVPYQVVLDKRTRQMTGVQKPTPYKLPPLRVAPPPRFQPPGINEFDLGGGGGGPPEQEKDKGGKGGRPSIPAALIVPTGFGVLHQFFAVILNVGNLAPAGSNIRLDSISATIDAPLQMKVAKTMPAVTIGKPVPIYNAATGETFLVAGAEGSAEWTLEALKAGTHSIALDVRATYQAPNQQDVVLKGRVTTSLVVSDPRFQITFSHPDTVRQDEEYTSYAFITNLSADTQHVELDTNYVPKCDAVSPQFSTTYICRVDDASNVKRSIAPGDTETVPYRLKSRISGSVFAGSGTANDSALSVAVQLTMGVSESGIPLSPATLVMPHYTRFLSKEFVDANMQLLGLGYSLATAPLGPFTAKHPRLIKNDVFQRAQDIARAGQRVFISRDDLDVSNAEENREPLMHLALDLLGNIERVDAAGGVPELREWDQLRRSEKAGRRAGAAIARQLELNNATGTATEFVDDFAAATSHRMPFLVAVVNGDAVAGKVRPYALSVRGVTSGGELDVPSEATVGWVRTLPFAELSTFTAAGKPGELAMVGRWNEDLEITVIPQAGSFTIDLIYPDTANGSQLRGNIAISNATVGQPVTFVLSRGNRTLIVDGATAAPRVDPVAQTALTAVAAAQDLHLDKGGHIVTMLFNRPIDPGEATTLRDRMDLTIEVPKANYSVTRRNVPNGDPATSDLKIPGATLQEDGKILTISFDKSLSTNATYKIGLDTLKDRLIPSMTYGAPAIIPRIDNDAPGGILTGKVLLGDNTPVKDAVVRLQAKTGQQYDTSLADGRFMFEFVARDIDNDIYGDYELYTVLPTDVSKDTKVEGAVRLPREVHTVNLAFLGRGSVEGQVRYDDGEILAGQHVTIGSTLYREFRSGVTDANGNFKVSDLPVGPLTFSVVDPSGRPTFAANAIRVPGEVVHQDLVIVKRQFPGTGTVRVTVRRSDIADPVASLVANAHVGVYTQGYALTDGFTGVDGTYEFTNVPAGLVSILAADFGITRESAAEEVDLKPDTTVERTLVLRVRDNTTVYATIDGILEKDDPTAPGDATKVTPVPGGIISIKGLPAITADATGYYVISDVPTTFAGREVWVFDPVTGRKGQFNLPTLVAGTNRFSPRLRTGAPEGTAKMRVRVFGPRGEPVNGYKVLSPGFPPEYFSEIGNGVYELPNQDVPLEMEVVAVPGTNKSYGYQYATGRVRVDFNGQIGVTDLRLPGQGTVRVKVLQEEPECDPGPPPCYTLSFATASISYPVWIDEEQDFGSHTEVVTADIATNIITFNKVPALISLPISTVDHPAGHASATTQLLLEGDVRNVELTLKQLGDVRGRVYLHDRRTPAAGATVRFLTGNYTYSTVQAGPDGSFRFPAIGRGVGFRVQAEMFQDGIYRTGFADGSTPSGGGPVNNVIVVMREQSTVEGRVVDAAGAAVPLAYYWLRELAWPYRSFGTQQDPLTADKDGKFVVSNVFTGAFRISAVSPDVQEFRGHYAGTIGFEGDATERDIEVQITGGGTTSGSISVTVLDPSKALEVVENAEISLHRDGRPFDTQTTNASGVAFFTQIPTTGTYRVFAYSKGRGRGGSSGNFSVVSEPPVAVQVLLTFLGNADGFVTDPESEPVANARVPGIPVTLQSGQVGTRASTDANGVFLFQGVPEGSFTLAAYDLDSGRMGFNTAPLALSTTVPEVKDIHLELERYADINVKAYLPNDAGGQGQLAPLVDVLVTQTDYVRQAQGNNLNFRKMLPRYGFTVLVKELGGENREVKVHGNFGGTLHKDVVVIFPSHGSVEVKVVDGLNKPVADARVQINGQVLFTPADGMVKLTGVPFGWVSVTATKDTVSSSRGGSLQSRTVPLAFELSLGNNASAEGYVEAEGSPTPSVGTRVLMIVRSTLIVPGGQTTLETLTGTDGKYRFTGIPIGTTSLDLKFYGPDDTTVGDTLLVTVPNTTTGTIPIPTAKLDATPPVVIDIQPPANSTNVSPSADIVVTFSEQLDGAMLSPAQVNNWFKLFATDTNTQVTLGVTPSLRPDGTYVVTLTPPPAPLPQKFPLKSNTIYRFAIPAGLKDTTGNGMKIAIGSSFTTVNYTEPAVVRVTPVEEDPVVLGTTFRVKFNKAIDIHSFDTGQGGVVKLEKLVAYKGAPDGEPKTISFYMDNVDPTTLVVAPMGWPIEESSFYRLTVSGVKDLQVPPNVQKDAKVVDYFSFDLTAPAVTIQSPVATGEKLVSGATYLATVKMFEPNGTTESTDVKLVDWFDEAGNHKKRTTVKPYEFSFVAPSVTTEGTYTLRASATDLSNNESERVSFTWTVIPNSPPQNLTATNTVTALYPTRRTRTNISFTDEDLEVTVNVNLKVKRLDGSEPDLFVASQKLTRSNINTPFPPVSYEYAIPDDAAAGPATVIVTARDINQKESSTTVPLEILADTTAPEIISITPKTETHYSFNQTYTVEVKVRDNETKISKLELVYDPKKPIETIGSPTIDAATGIYTFRKTVTVPNKNVDTRVHTTATVTDLRGNVGEGFTDIIWDRVEDENVPTAEWITPLDGAALPKGQTSWDTTLRVRATDNVKVTSVTFVSPAISGNSVSVTTPKSGTTDIFEAKVPLNITGDVPFVITAQVADGDEAHLVELPITINPVSLGTTQPITAAFSISPVNVASYVDASVFVRSGAKLVITTPVRLKNLILADGASVNTLEETGVDLTVTDNLFVDADSSINVTGKGYLGGLRSREGGGLSNSSRTGRTLGGTTTGGAFDADASYAGFGGSYLGSTNATYGSITDPVDMGSGGGAQPEGGSRPGGNGGGAVSVRGENARFVIAGDVFANADDRTPCNCWTAGSGGSVLLQSRTLITGPDTKITANGADENSPQANVDLGGGGGRISIRATERLDLSPTLPVIQARGGRHGNETPGNVDGGAGTIFLSRPGATTGELIVSAFDSRYTSSAHLTAGTPLSGTLDFEKITIGPRALARFDTTPTGTMTVDPTALVLSPEDVPVASIVSTTPAAGASVAQSTSVTAQYSASSIAGIREVRTILSAQPTDVIARPTWVTQIPGTTTSTINVPANAANGAATLKLRVTDRSGRVVETAPVSFEVVTNAGPAITQFDVTPLSAYAGRPIAVNAAANDDIAVTSLDLTTSNGTVVKQTPVASGTSMTRSFTVTTLPSATPGTPVQLTLSALDAFPNRVPTTQTQSIEILHDAVAPVMTVARPVANEQFNEAPGATFPVQVTATDAEVAVKTVIATFEGTNYPLSAVAGQPGVYSTTIPVPSNVDGADPVEKALRIVASDYENNAFTHDAKIYIKPAIDPEAPTVTWLCSSSGAMYPAGYEVRLRASAAAQAGSSITSVTISVDGQAALTTTNPSAGVWEAKFTIPGGTAAGTVYTARARAVSLGGKETTIPVTFTVVEGTRLTSTSTINANDTGYGPQSTYIVESGGVLTIIGPRAFKNLIVLGTGVVIHQQVSTTTPDMLTVEKLYVGCDAKLDVSAQGYGRNTAYPGSGAPLDSSSGSHIGRGGSWSGNFNGIMYGNIYRPTEKGGGGHTTSPSVTTTGGGVLRLMASSAVIIDGSVKANGFDSGTWGAGGGGSIWITTSGQLTGGGSIEARGGGDTNNRTGGGGGAVALEYGSLGGTLVNNVLVRGGKSTAGNPGGGGSIYLKGPQSVYGDVIFDNANVDSVQPSALPALGTHTVDSVNGATATLKYRDYIPGYLTGNWVKVVAPDGTVRGTWRIASIVNDPGAALPPYSGYDASDGSAYDGYIVYIPAGYGPTARQLVPAKYENSQWQADNGNQTFTAFTPQAAHRVIASFSKNTAGVLSIEQLRCATTCGSVNGIQIGELVSGIARPNLYHTGSATEVQYILENAHEFFFGYDSQGRALAITQIPAQVTLEAADGAPVVLQPGDSLRGVFRFDSVKVKGKAKVFTRDAVESTTAPVIESGSTFSPGDPEGPAIDTTKVSFTKGLLSPVAVGANGAVTDPNGKVDVFVRNASKPALPRFPELTDASFVFPSYETSLELRKMSVSSTGGTISMEEPAGDYAQLTFRVATPGFLAGVGIVDHYFHFPSTTPASARGEIWPNGAWVNSGNKQGP